MTTKVSALNDALTSVVTGMRAAVAYSVFDGPPTKRPGRTVTQYLVIGAEQLDDQANPTTAATMNQSFSGLGQIARDEHIEIHCVAVGRAIADQITTARAAAMSIVQDVGAYLAANKHPTNELYNMLVSDVSAAQVHNTPGGAIVHIQFVISAEANLI